MAQTRRSSLVSRPTLVVGSQQVLNKVKWIPIPNGGFVRRYELEEKGYNLLRLVTLEEVKPETKYYMKDALQTETYNETSFHPSVSWDTIMEFVNTKKIYVRVDKSSQDNSNTATTKQEEGPTQSAMF